MPANMKEYIAEDQHLRSKRANWENLWQDVGDLVNPSANNITRQVTEGEDKTWHRYDSTAVVANKERAAHLAGILANPETNWLGIKVSGVSDEDKENPELKQWLEDSSKVVMEMLKEPSSRFYEELDKVLIDDGSFGCVAMLVQPGRKSKVNFKAYGVNSFTFALDDEGNLERFFLTIKLTLNQLVSKFGLSNLSQKLQDEYKASKRRYQEYEIMHLVVPRTVRDRNKDDIFNKRFAGYFAEKGTCHMIDEQGYDEMPYEVFMERQRADEDYADSPAIDTIDLIRQLNYEAWLYDYGSEMAFMPPLEVPDDGIAGGEIIDASPGGSVVVSASARKTGNVVRPIFMVGDIRPVQESMAVKQAQVRMAFLVEELEAMRKSNMSATEAIINNDRQLRKASPTVRRLFASLSRVLTRAIEIVWEHDIRVGKTKGDQLEESDIVMPMPPKIIGNINSTALKFEFSSPISRAMRAEENEALLQQLQAVTMFMQIDPTIRFRYNTHQAFKHMSQNTGVPPNTMRSDEVVDKAIEAEQKQQEQQQTMDNMERAAGIADVAGKAAQSIGG